MMRENQTAREDWGTDNDFKYLYISFFFGGGGGGRDFCRKT